MNSAFLLDTNVSSEEMRKFPDPATRAWVLAQPFSSLFLSSITIGEIRKGIALLPQGQQKATLQTWLENRLIPSFNGHIFPVTMQIADRWGSLTARRQLAGKPLSAEDGLIAATALEHNLTLVTRNVKDFAGLGLRILNPWDLQP